MDRELDWLEVTGDEPWLLRACSSERVGSLDALEWGSGSAWAFRDGQTWHVFEGATELSTFPVRPHRGFSTPDPLFVDASLLPS